MPDPDILKVRWQVYRCEDALRMREFAGDAACGIELHDSRRPEFTPPEVVCDTDHTECAHAFYPQILQYICDLHNQSLHA